MPSTARSSRLGSSLSARVTSQLGIAFTRAGAWRHPVTSTVNRAQPKKLRFMTYGFVPAVPKPVGLAPVESIRRGSASGTVFSRLNDTVTASCPRRPESREPRAGQHGARRAWVARSSGFGSIWVAAERPDSPTCGRRSASAGRLLSCSERRGSRHSFGDIWITPIVAPRRWRHDCIRAGLPSEAPPSALTQCHAGSRHLGHLADSSLMMPLEASRRRRRGADPRIVGRL